MKPGDIYTAALIVAPEHTAAAMGSGDLPVLATPAIIALMENAAMLALKPSLEAGQSSVGTAISVEHLKASPIGARIEAVATVIAIDGRRVEFSVEAREVPGSGDPVPIGRGTHTRFIVDAVRFLGKITQ